MEPRAPGADHPVGSDRRLGGRRRPGQRLPRVAIALALVLGSGALPAATTAATTYSLDLASSRDYVAQANFVQCVGASMQMMINIVAPRDDRSTATQRRLQDLARTLSGPRPVGRERQGASVRGWTAGLNHLGYGPYRLLGETSLEAALKTAARAIRMTGRPVGLLVWRGRHAWVMSGFQATADPAVTDRFEVTAASILDPLYPHGSKTWGPSPKPGTWTPVERVGRQFVARGSGPSSARWLSSSLDGRWVLVLPIDLPTDRSALRFS
jgi:hypothetical protein